MSFLVFPNSQQSTSESSSPKHSTVSDAQTIAYTTTHSPSVETASASTLSPSTPENQFSSSVRRHRHRHHRRVADGSPSPPSHSSKHVSSSRDAGSELNAEIPGQEINDCSISKEKFINGFSFAATPPPTEHKNEDISDGGSGAFTSLQKSPDGSNELQLQSPFRGGTCEWPPASWNKENGLSSSSTENLSINKGANAEKLKSFGDEGHQGQPQTCPTRKRSGSTLGLTMDRHVSSMQVLFAEQALIGKGSSGKVFRAMDRKTNRLIAVKEIPIKNLSPVAQNGLRERKRNSSLIILQDNSAHAELETLRQLNHPNIVKFLGEETDLTTGSIRIYMDLVSGGSIRSLLLTYGKFDEDQAASYTKQVLCGLVYLHSKNIVHRDLKGDNLLVEPSGVLKLADFGTAGMVSAGNKKQEINGTAFFMSPEVLTNESHITEKADIWSLGCCVIEMMVGKPPLAHLQGQYAVMMMIAESTGELIKEYMPAESINWSSELVDFLKQCLRRDPKERPSAAELLNHPWIHNRANPASPNAWTPPFSPICEKKVVTTVENDFQTKLVPKMSVKNTLDEMQEKELSTPVQQMVTTSKPSAQQRNKNPHKNDVFGPSNDEISVDGKRMKNNTSLYNSKLRRYPRENRSPSYQRQSSRTPKLNSRNNRKFAVREYYTHTHFYAEEPRETKKRRNRCLSVSDSYSLPPIRNRQLTYYPAYNTDATSRPLPLIRPSSKYDRTEGGVTRERMRDEPSRLRTRRPEKERQQFGRNTRNGSAKNDSIERKRRVHYEERKERVSPRPWKELAVVPRAPPPSRQRENTPNRTRRTYSVGFRQNPLELFKRDPHHIYHAFPRWTDEAQTAPKKRVLQPYIRVPDGPRTYRY